MILWNRNTVKCSGLWYHSVNVLIKIIFSAENPLNSHFLTLRLRTGSAWPEPESENVKPEAGQKLNSWFQIWPEYGLNLKTSRQGQVQDIWNFNKSFTQKPGPDLTWPAVQIRWNLNQTRIKTFFLFQVHVRSNLICSGPYSSVPSWPHFVRLNRVGRNNITHLCHYFKPWYTVYTTWVNSFLWPT